MTRGFRVLLRVGFEPTKQCVAVHRDRFGSRLPIMTCDIAFVELIRGVIFAGGAIAQNRNLIISKTQVSFTLTRAKDV